MGKRERNRTRPRLIEPSKAKPAEGQLALWEGYNQDAADYIPVREDRMPRATGACHVDWGGGYITPHLRIPVRLAGAVVYEGGARLPYATFDQFRRYEARLRLEYEKALYMEAIAHRALNLI